MKNYCPIIIFLFLLSGCVKDKPEEQVNTPVNLSGSKKVFVVNEGNFNTGNASVTLYDPADKSVVEDIYQSQNNSALGDVAQSMNGAKGNYYLAVNNSGKIVVCDATFKKTGQISGLSSPRYFLQVTQQKAYVSDLKSNAVHVIDLNSNTETGSIPCPGWTEQMVMIYNKVFVCNLRRNYVYVINTMNDKIEDSVFVGINAAGIQLDRNDKIWALSSGDQPNATPRLSRINPISNEVEQYFDFAGTGSPAALCFNRTRDSLYFINGNIYRMLITDAQIPQEAFIQKGSKVFYGLGVNPHTYEVYAADVLDYVQRSQIYIYDTKGKQSSTFKAGIISNGFYFE